MYYIRIGGKIRIVRRNFEDALAASRRYPLGTIVETREGVQLAKVVSPFTPSPHNLAVPAMNGLSPNWGNAA